MIDLYFGVSVVVALLHLLDMLLGQEFVQQRVALGVANFMLDGYLAVLQVHYCILQLHRVLWCIG
jgi:hypothetical protein